MNPATSNSAAPSAPRIELDDLFPLDDPPVPLKASTMRWYSRHRESNGFARCMVRIGKRDFVVRSRFAEWLGKQLESQPPSPPARRRGGGR
ncbi:MAG TPA: hypothetical protein PJ986_04655 [Gammaproteobacteria bacterium]|nr:hypothetical protein [Gammaproteobacteria bacterium]